MKTQKKESFCKKYAIYNLQKGKDFIRN